MNTIFHLSVLIGLLLIFPTSGSLKAKRHYKKGLNAEDRDRIHDDEMKNREVTTCQTTDEVGGPVRNSTLEESDDEQASDGTANAKSSERQNKKHLRHLTITITVGGQEYILDLLLNRNLFAASYQEVIRNNDDEPVINNVDLGATHCYYTGRVRNYNDSLVAVSTCNGIWGYFEVDGEVYDIMPDDVNDACVSCRHRVTKASPLRKMFKGPKDVFGKSNTELRRKKRAALYYPQDLDGQVRVMESYLVVTFDLIQKYSGSVPDTIARMKLLANMANALFNQENIVLVLVGMELWTGSNKLDTSQNGNTLIDEFDTYTIDNLPRSDTYSLMMVNINFEFLIVGLAFGSVCSDKYRGTLVADPDDVPDDSASTLTHELAHLLQIYHPEDYEQEGEICNCNGFCIMGDGYGPDVWSDCSKRRLPKGSQYIKELDICLLDVPQTFYDPTPYCGNGIVEDGEECDCGNFASTQCNPACCDANTCKLTGSAKCAFGRCCDVAKCTLKPKYTSCRDAASSCDLAEYCSGSTHICPSDVYKSDYTSCTVNSKQGYCYTGKCVNREYQCKRLWGTAAKESAAACYEQLNTAGEFDGACKKNPDGSFVACTAANVLCGLLQCDTDGNDGQFLPNFDETYFSTTNVGTSTCLSTEFTTDDISRDFSFVQNGAPCGTGKACKDQQCSDLSSLQTDCGNCNSRGVCNSLGKCHCEEGYAPPDCSQPGEGGSEHSNAISPLVTPELSTGTTAADSSLSTITGAITTESMTTTTTSTTTSTSTSTTTTTPDGATDEAGGSTASNTPLIIGASVGGAVLLLCLLLFAYFLLRGRTGQGLSPPPAAASAPRQYYPRAYQPRRYPSYPVAPRRYNNPYSYNQRMAPAPAYYNPYRMM